MKAWLVRGCFCLLILANSAQAFIVIDATRLAKYFKEITQQLKQLDEAKSWMKKTFTLDGKAADALISDKQNNAANKIIRLNQVDLSIQNQRTKRDYLPVANVCNTYNISHWLSSNRCGYQDFFSHLDRGRVQHWLNSNPDKAGQDTHYISEQTKELGVLSPEKQLAVTDASQFEGIGGKALAVDKDNDLNDFIYLAGAKVNIPLDPRRKDSEKGKKQSMLRLQAISQSEAANALLSDGLNANRSVQGGPSVRQLMSAQGETFVSDPGALLTLNQDKEMTPSAALRQRAVLLAYQNSMVVKQYQQLLKREFLLSNLVIHQLTIEKNRGEK